MRQTFIASNSNTNNNNNSNFTNKYVPTIETVKTVKKSTPVVQISTPKTEEFNADCEINYKFMSRKLYKQKRRGNEKYKPHSGEIVTDETSQEETEETSNEGSSRLNFVDDKNFQEVEEAIRKRLNHVPSVHDLSDIQFPNGSLAALSSLRQSNCSPGYVALIGHIESVVCLLVLLSEVQTVKGYAAAILQYVHRYVEGSLLVTAYDYINELMIEINEPFYVHQSGEVEIAGNVKARPKWMDTIRSMFENWTLFLNAPIFKHISKILTMAISLGLCSLTKEDVSFKGVQLFSIAAEKKHSTALDFLDAVLTTAHYFVETGYAVVTTGSLRPLLFEKSTLSRVDELYFRVKGAMTVLSSGNLPSSGVKDENDLILLIDQGIVEYGGLLAACKDPMARITLEKRYVNFREWRLEFLAKTAGGGLREAPFGLFIKGPPGIGKSVMTSTFMNSLLIANGFDASPERIVTINLGDKFMSNYKSSVNGVIADDIGQGVPKYETTNPARVLIDIINNTISYANKAEVEDKGMVTIRPKIFIGNSNTEYMGFHEYLTCPSAGMRRGVHLEVKLRDSIATDGKFDREKYETFLVNFPDPIDQVCPDIYLFSLFNYSVGDNITNIKKTPVKWNGKTMAAVSYKTCMECVLDLSKKHFIAQKKLVTALNNQPKLISLCKCGKLNYLCNCEMKPHFLSVPTASTVVSQCANAALFAAYEAMCTVFSQYTWFKVLALFIYRRDVLLDIRRAFIFCFISTFFSIFLGGFPGIVFMLLCYVILAAWAYASMYLYTHRLHNERNALVNYMHRPHIFATTAVGLAVSALYVAYRAFRGMKPHGNLNPKDVSDIVMRDREVNVWAQHIVEALPVSEKSGTTTPQQLANLICKNTVHVERVDPDSTKICFGFMARSGIMLLPRHMILSTATVFRFSRYKKGVLGSTFQQHICFKDVYPFPNSDMVAVYTPNGGDWKDLSEYFQLDIHKDRYSLLVYKDGEGNNIIDKGFKISYRNNLSNFVSRFNGYEYCLNSTVTFEGLCMATLIIEQPCPVIAGFHIGGVSGTPRGCAVCITKPQFDVAMKFFEQNHGMMLAHSSGTFRTEIFGNSEFYLSKTTRDSSPLCFMPEVPSAIKVLGTVTGAQTYYTEVIRSPICDVIKEVCSTPQEYSGPKFKRGKAIWRDNFLKTTAPAIGPTLFEVNRAVVDYLHDVRPLYRRSDMRLHSRPLTDLETVNGIPGVRFIDRMNMSKSVGFPNKGPKSAIMEQVDDVNVTFEPHIWHEVSKLEEKYLAGERVYPVFRGCLKDEIKSVDSQKVRVFQAAPLELQILIRKYFLGLARTLSMFPLISECAVGINAMSDEWQQLDDHILKYGNAVIAGDYDGYDTRMSSIVTTAAFSILIEMAKETGNYTENDLTIMRGIATDVIYPVTAMNGDLVMFLGTTPSGHNLTVYINSICNSLLLRCGLFGVYPEYTGKFSDAVSVTTYGDDFKGSVHKAFRNFNFLTYQDYLRTVGSILTMPDKKSEAVEFLDNTCDFLKRRTSFIPEINCKVGALGEESIFKSLKAMVPSKYVSKEQAMAINIDGALREWFLHGRELFSLRHEQMKQVAARCDLTNRIATLQLDFDQRVEIWKSKNAPEIIIDTMDNI